MEIEKTSAPKEPMILSSRKKWFWIGIVLTIMDQTAGVIYGIALLLEPPYKREGRIILIWNVFFFLLKVIVIYLLFKNGLIPDPPTYLPYSKLLPMQ